MERYQEAIQEYAQLDNREILEQREFPPINELGLPMPILVSLKQLFLSLEKALEIEFDDQIAYELATLLSDQEEFQKSPDLLQTN